MNKSSKNQKEYLPEDGSVTRIADGGWGWLVVFSSFIISVIGDGFTYTTGIFYEHFLKVYGKSETITSMFSSIMTGTIYCIGPFASGLVKAYGCRRIAIMGTLLSVSGMISSILLDSIYIHCITLGIITGCGLGMLYLTQIIIIPFWFDKRLSFATGIAVCGSGIGIACFSVISEWLIIRFSWKGAMLMISGIVFTLVAFSSTYRNNGYTIENGDLRASLKETLNFCIMKDPVFLYFTFANFLNSLVYFVPLLFMKDRIIKLGIGNANDSVKIMVCFGLSNAFGRAMFGYIADIESINRLILYSLSVITYGIVIGLTTLATSNFYLMAMFYSLYGITEGAYCLSPVVLVDLLGVEKLSNIFGILSFAEGIAAAIGPPLIGLTVNESYETGIIISSFITILSGILFLFLPKIHKKFKTINNNDLR